MPRWERLEQQGEVPVERSSHSITAVGDKLFLFGGEHDPRVPIGSDVFVYDLGNSTWSVLQTSGTPPSPRVAHAAAAIGSNLWFYGGRRGVAMGEGALGDLFVLDTMTGAWTSLPTQGTAPPDRSYHAMTAAGAKLYVFGGCGAEGRLNDLWEFDTQTGTWRALPSNPDIKPRGGASLIASSDGKSLYVIGGFCGHELADMHRFDVAAGTWDTCSALPTARSVLGVGTHACSGACGNDGAILAYGGEVDPSDKGHEGAGDFCAELLGHSAGGAWLSLDSSGEGPGPRGWYACTTHKGDLVVHGGLGADNARRGDMYILRMHT